MGRWFLLFQHWANASQEDLMLTEPLTQLETAVLADWTHWTLAQGRLPWGWQWPATLALMDHLQACSPHALNQLVQQFAVMGVEELPRQSTPAQTLLYRFQQLGTRLLFTGQYQPSPSVTLNWPGKITFATPKLTQYALPSIWPSQQVADLLPNVIQADKAHDTTDSVFAETVRVGQFASLSEETEAVVAFLKALPDQGILPHADGTKRPTQWRDVLIAVPNQALKQHWQGVLQNSFASDDAPVAVWRYARFMRQALTAWCDGATVFDAQSLLQRHLGRQGIAHDTANALESLLTLLANPNRDALTEWVWNSLHLWQQWSGQPFNACAWQLVQQHWLNPVTQDYVAVNHREQAVELLHQGLRQLQEALLPLPGYAPRLLTLAEARGVLAPVLVLPSLLEKPPNPLRLLHQKGFAAGSGDDENLTEMVYRTLQGGAISIWLSTHTPTETETTVGQPWGLFTAFQRGLMALGARPAKLDRPLTPAVSADAPPSPAVEPLPWNNVVRQAAPLPIWPGHTPLSLSPSRLETYLKCPGQFYFKSLLRLPEPSSPNALQGRLIHLLMEQFNRQVSEQAVAHAPEPLLAMARHWLDVSLHANQPPPAAWQHSPLYDEFCLLTPLEQADLRHAVVSSLTHLANSGYFSKPVAYIWPELQLRNVALPQLEGVRLTGTLDAVVLYTDGTLALLDYKTGVQQFTTSKAEDHLNATLEALDPLAQDHAQRFPVKALEAGQRHLQLPLYTLGLQHAPLPDNFPSHTSLSKAALQLVRTPKAGNPFSGCHTVALDLPRFQQEQDRWLADLRHFVVNPIRQATQLPPVPRPTVCERCHYNWLCPSQAADQTTEEEPLAHVASL